MKYNVSEKSKILDLVEMTSEVIWPIFYPKKKLIYFLITIFYKLSHLRVLVSWACRGPLVIPAPREAEEGRLQI